MQLCTVNRRQPSTAEDVDLCLQAVTLDNLRQRMLTSWRNRPARVGGPELSTDVPEDVLGQLLSDLKRALEWPRTWAQLRKDLAAAGIRSTRRSRRGHPRSPRRYLHPGVRPNPPGGPLPLYPRPRGAAAIRGSASPDRITLVESVADALAPPGCGAMASFWEELRDLHRSRTGRAPVE